MSDFTIDSDHVKKKANELYDLEDEIKRSISNLFQDTLQHEKSFAAEAFSIGDALGQVADKWRASHVDPSVKRIRNVGEFLEAHSRKATDADEESASGFVVTDFSSSDHSQPQPGTEFGDPRGPVA